MQAIDRTTIKSYGIPSLVLMERAGLAVVERIEERLPDHHKALVLAGPGNNGGDGIMVARELHNRGYRVKVLIAGKKDKLSRDCKAQYEAALKFGVPVRLSSRVEPADLHGAFVVDALFGTGLKKPVTGTIADLIEEVNSSGSPVVSIDIPSGISADTGQALGASIQADLTVTFGCPKRGHLQYPGASHTGELFVHDIGFPRELFNTIECNVLDETDIALLVPEREPDSHKGDHGHLLMLAGHTGKTGAAFMAAEAALRSGAGLVTLGAPESMKDIYQSRVTEAMTLPLASTETGAFSIDAIETILSFIYESADAIVIGPGIGQHVDTARLVEELIIASPVPVVLDADGLNCLGKRTSKVLGSSRAPVILTPHPGEFSRISGMDADDIQADRLTAASGFARKSGAYVVLKGAPTVIAGPEGEMFINTTGGPALAKGGTGDVLSGMLGALLAQGLNPLEAALLGVYAHGLAGDIAALSHGTLSTLASDVTGYISGAFMRLSGEGQ